MGNATATTPAPAADEFLTKAEAAAYMRASEKFIETLVKRGELVPIRRGIRPFFRRADVAGLMAAKG